MENQDKPPLVPLNDESTTNDVIAGYTFNAKQSEASRKFKRIVVAEKTIEWSLFGLTVWGAMILTIIAANTAYFKMDLTNEIYFLTLIVSGILNIITLALGFVAGSSID